MQAATVVNTLHAAGVTITATPDGTIQARPVSAITGELAYLIRTNKPALLDYLRQQAANDPGHADDQADAADPDRWNWPHSDAANSAEIAVMVARAALFAQRGLPHDWSSALVDKLLKRDREGDDRRACLECLHLTGRTCGSWRQAGIGGAQLPAELTAKLQRCPAFQPAPLAIEKGVPPSTVTAAPAAEKAAARAKTTSSNAKTAEETALMAVRLARFAGLGLDQAAAAKMTNGLLARDRKADRKHCCAECERLSSRHTCAPLKRALGGGRVSDSMLTTLHQCRYFKSAPLATKEGATP